MAIKYENKLVKNLDKSFQELLKKQFEYTTETKMNINVRHEVASDVWNLFLVLLAENNFDKETTKSIYSLLKKEIHRRKNLA